MELKAKIFTLLQMYLVHMKKTNWYFVKKMSENGRRKERCQIGWEKDEKKDEKKEQNIVDQTDREEKRQQENENK